MRKVEEKIPAQIPFDSRRRRIVSNVMDRDFQGLGLQLQKTGRITMILGLSATLHRVR